MNLKLAVFCGKSEDFPAWSTKFVALIHTKGEGLFRRVMGNDDLPEAEPTLPESMKAESTGSLQYRDARASSVDPADGRKSKHSRKKTIMFYFRKNIRVLREKVGINDFNTVKKPIIEIKHYRLIHIFFG